jgi:hypothetical protein
MGRLLAVATTSLETIFQRQFPPAFESVTGAKKVAAGRKKICGHTGK